MKKKIIPDIQRLRSLLKEVVKTIVQQEERIYTRNMKIV